MEETPKQRASFVCVCSISPDALPSNLMKTTQFVSVFVEFFCNFDGNVMTVCPGEPTICCTATVSHN